MADTLQWREEPPNVEGWWLHAYSEWSMHLPPIRLEFTGPVNGRKASDQHRWMGPIPLPEMEDE